MKILRIAGRNLASLAGDFSVDFEADPLASTGLFAMRCAWPCTGRPRACPRARVAPAHFPT
jgi:hypothetical protein